MYANLWKRRTCTPKITHVLIYQRYMWAAQQSVPTVMGRFPANVVIMPYMSANDIDYYRFIF